jgi:hypothetical protein
LRVKLGPRSKALLKRAQAGDKEIGIVWHKDEEEDMAIFPICLLIWRAMTQHKHSVVVGGRRTIAAGWVNHAMGVLRDACSEISRDVLFVKENRSFGLCTSTGVWILRFDGPLHEDYWESMDVTQGADVLFGDFNWIDRAIFNDALGDARLGGHLAIIVTAGT